MKHTTKPGFIYVLTHPSMPGEYKIGVTTQKVEKRLAQHNTNYSKIAGQIVKDTGLKWELREYHPVEDIYHAENEFWEATGIADIPFRGGIEIFPMDCNIVKIGLNAAKNAGERPLPKNHDKLIHNREWMIKELKGTGIILIGEKFNHIQYTEFQCDNGHIFREIPRILEKNKSCPVCDSDKEENIDLMLQGWAEDNQLHLITEFDGYKARFIDIEKSPKSKWRLWIELIQGHDLCMIHCWDYENQNYELASKLESLGENLDLIYKKILEGKWK